MTATLDKCRTYTPYGGAADLFRCRDGAIIYDGPAGTGKTRAVLEKANLAAMKYEGCRILLVRKTRVSMTESVLVTMETKVLPEGSQMFGSAQRAQRQKYVYPNGSEIILGGLDNVDRLMSTEYDMICCFESTEITEDDFDKLITRLRNNMMPYQQIICDCNPSYPKHWLKVKADAGGLTRIMSRHEDNPSITQDYLDRLSKLTGHRRNRLFLGKWVAAEGVIYERWDEKKFVCSKPDFEYDLAFIGIDHGYTNPCAMHVYLVDNDGRVHVAEEFYKTEQLEPMVVEAVTGWSSKYGIENLIVDPSAATLKAALANAGHAVFDAQNDVYSGIQTCQKYLEIPEDGKPRLTVDPSCKNFINEIENYSWKENRDGTKQDKPDKVNDHAMDEFRYSMMHIDSIYGNGSMEVITI